MFEVKSKFGSGGQHEVGKLEDNRLIKFPHKLGRLWEKSTAKTVEGDLKIHEEHNVPIPETEVVGQPTIDTGSKVIKPPYAIISEEISGRIFRELDLENPNIFEQFKRLLSTSIDIRGKYAAALDFLGGRALKEFITYLFKEKQPGQLGAYNIFIDDNDKLILIDTNLLTPARTRRTIKWYIKSVMDLQHSLIANLIQDRPLQDEARDQNYYRTTTKLADKLYNLSRRIEAKRTQTTS